MERHSRTMVSKKPSHQLKSIVIHLHGVLKSPQRTVELDRVHRALGPRPNDPERPRDVCHIQRYPQKELILRAAWEAGDIDFKWGSY